MFKIIATFLDKEIGPDLFLDGAVELKMHPTNFNSEKEALDFIRTEEVKRIKEQFASEGGVSPEVIDATYKHVGKQAYIDVLADLGAPLNEMYFGRYIYKVVKI